MCVVEVFENWRDLEVVPSKKRKLGGLEVGDGVASVGKEAAETPAVRKQRKKQRSKNTGGTQAGVGRWKAERECECKSTSLPGHLPHLE